MSGTLAGRGASPPPAAPSPGASIPRHLPAAVLLLALCALPVASAAEPPGPQIGNVVYRASIRSGVEGTDADEYQARFAAGERLSVEVSSPSTSSLYPRIEIVSPDGDPAEVDVSSRRFGRSLSVRDWPVPATGTWTVRISAEFGSEGSYVARFSVRPAPPVRVAVPPDTSGTSSSLDLPFEALDGAKLDLRAVAGRGSVPALAAFTDPGGAAVAGPSGTAVEAARVKGRILTLPSLPLRDGDGTYRLRFDLAPGHDGLTVEASVRSPRRVAGRRHLSDREPFLDARITPHRGTTERGVRITGRNLSASPAPTVLFGGIPGTVDLTDPFGNYLDVTPPLLTDGALVSVAVVNSDGQAYEREGYFYFVPPPRIDAIFDSAGRAVRGARPEGGATLTIRGDDFESGIWLNFGPSEDVLPVILDAQTLRVVVPPHLASIVDLRIHDAYLHDEVAPFPFEYKDPPSVFAVPYLPAEPPGDGTTWASLAGVGFETDDVVLFDGAATETVRPAPGTLLFLVPVAPPGSHVVTVRDRVGTVVAAPQITTR